MFKRYFVLSVIIIFSIILIDKGYGDRIGTGLFYRKLVNKKEGFYALFFVSF